MVKTEDFILRYTNCWEDPNLLIDQFREAKHKNILSICSGGDNSLSLLVANPKSITVVDINPKQLYLLELKMAAIKCLSYEDCLQFLGFYPCEKRVKHFNNIKQGLSKEASLYWIKNLKKINKGIVLSGHLERNLRLFANYYRPLIHSINTVDKLLEPKSAEDQSFTYQSKWNNLRWRMMFRIFFNNTLLRIIAPDPDFFNYVSENVGVYLLRKCSAHFSDPACQSNPFLHYALKGNFKDCLPHAWQKQNYLSIKSQLHKIRLHCGFAETAPLPGSGFDFFNLSNIFEYTTLDELKNIGRSLYNCASEDAKIVYWNILLQRKLSDELPDYFNCRTISVDNPADQGWVYNRFIVESVIK